MEPVAVLSATVTLAMGSIAAVYLRSRSRVAAGSGVTDAARNAEHAVDRDDGVVHCPNCGTENELGYRYCANCVGELPGGVSTTSSGMQPNRRGML